MYDKDNAAIVAPLATLSLNELAQYAVEEALIERFEISGSDATIVQGAQHFRLPHRQASTFLIGMLRGRSWYVDDPSRGGSASEQTVARMDGAAPAIAHANGGLPSFHREDMGDGRNLEQTLDSLLTFAKDIGIIRAYRKEPDLRLVQIDIAVCSSTFGYVEAVSYLFDCVQHVAQTATEAA